MLSENPFDTPLILPEKEGNKHFRIKRSEMVIYSCFPNSVQTKLREIFRIQE